MLKGSICGSFFKDMRGFNGHRNINPICKTCEPIPVSSNTIPQTQTNNPQINNFSDLKQQFKDQLEMLQMQEMIKTLKAPPQQQNTLKDTLEMIKMLKELNPTSPLQTYKEIKELIGSEGGSAEGGEGDTTKDLLAMIPLLLQQKQTAPVNVVPQTVQPQAAQPVESEEMNISELAADLLDYIPENYKQQVRDKKLSFEQIKALAVKQMPLLKTLFKKNYDTELTPELLDALLGEGYHQLTN